MLRPCVMNPPTTLKKDSIRTNHPKNEPLLIFRKLHFTAQKLYNQLENIKIQNLMFLIPITIGG
jgi:hypothetical protein